MIDTTPSGDKILITGTSSGLGKYLSDNIKCVSLTRENSSHIFDEHRDTHFDMILHCAFNSSKKIKDYYSYAEDNIFLTKRLLGLSHNKFVFFSSIDIYRDEDSPYKVTKLISEALVNSLSPGSLVLRLSAILGSSLKKNTLMKILQDEHPNLTLSGDSTFNYILEEDILGFVDEVRRHKEISGNMDFIANGNISLEKVAEKYDKQVRFGSYIYTTPDLKNIKIKKLFSHLALSSEENIERFIRKSSNV